MNNIKGIILDWAGTTIDYGSMTPIYAMLSAFKHFDIVLDAETIRKYMGLHKLIHIQSMLNEEIVKKQWEDQTNLTLIELSKAIFAKLLITTREEALIRSNPISGVVEFMNTMRENDIKFGSTTGYTRVMMNSIIPIAEEMGIYFDSVVTPDEVPYGRPYPFMIYKNAINMETFPLWKMIKIGDTIADIQEGINAGMWVIALTRCGNEVGFDENEIKDIPSDVLSMKINVAERKFIEEGAHYVADSIANTYEILEDINKKIGYGIMPLDNNK
jgi:phosphonoacetaldehyde hydrolase